MNCSINTPMPGDDLATETGRDEKFLEILLSQQIRPSDNYIRPLFTLEQNGVGFAPFGNLVAICAEMKSGKTWMMLQLAVTLLRHEYGNLRGIASDARIMWFDTEQDKYDSMLILRRVHQMCGWAYNESHPEFLLYNLRDISTEDRKSVIIEGIRKMKPTVVFIDGIRDLVRSVNEEEECYALINDLMTVTAQEGCAIWSVLHVNPNSDKMRGHLGTELGNKTTDVFSVKKKKDQQTGEVYFTVSHVAARHRDIEDWDFRIHDYPGTQLYSVPEMLTHAERSKADKNRWQALHDVMAKYIPDIRAVSKTALRDAIAKGEQLGGSKAWAMVQEAIGAGAIEQVIGGKYRLRSEPPIVSGQPGQQQEDLPF